MKIDKQLRQIFGSTLRFGGKSVLFFGDFNQLMPVTERFVFEPVSDGLNIFAGSPLWNDTKLFVLTEIMRQKDYLNFAKAPNNLANHSLTEEDIELFKSREIKESVQSFEDIYLGVVNLFYTNKEVVCYNVKFFY